ALRFYLGRYLADDILVKADRASMAASLELRAPFLDTHVVEFAARLPWRLKLSLTRTKVLLKRALRGVVPDEILRRPKKGFGIPAEGGRSCACWSREDPGSSARTSARACSRAATRWPRSTTSTRSIRSG